MTTDKNYASHVSGCLSKLRFSIEHLKSQDNSALIRFFCLIAAIIANSAVISMLGWPSWGLFVYTAIVSGFIVSYACRSKSSRPILLCIAVYMLLVIINFLIELCVNWNVPLKPLIKLLLLLHAGHCFDMPKRRDLNYSLFAGFAMLALTGVAAPDMNLTAYIVPYGVLFISVLRLYNHPRKGSSPNLAIIHSKQSHIFSRIFYIAIYVLSSVFFTFSFLVAITPENIIGHFQNYHLHLFYSEQNSKPQCAQRIAWNLANTPDEELLQKQIESENSENKIDTFKCINLDSCDVPGKELFMRVYSKAPVTYFREAGYNNYDGHRWTVNTTIEPHEIKKEETNAMIRGREMPFFLIDNNLSLNINTERKIYEIKKDNSPLLIMISDSLVAQLYCTEQNTGKHIFTPTKPMEFCFPSDKIYIDSADNLILPREIEQGTLYKITGRYNSIEYAKMKDDEPYIKYNYKYYDGNTSIYSMDQASFEEWDKHGLYNNAGENTSECGNLDKLADLEEFLQLPDTVTSRTYKLAKELTEGETTNVFKAVAIADYLGGNCKYQLVPPEYPKDKDCADWFIFEEKLGRCTHFATALTVLCRAANVPARFVTGYGYSYYDSEDGIYYIKESNAHAWTEIFTPEFGWVTIDATSSAEENDQNANDKKDKTNTPSPSPSPSPSPEDNEDSQDSNDQDDQLSKKYETAINWIRIHQTTVLLPMLLLLTSAELITVIIRRKLAKSRREKRYDFLTFTAEMLMQKISNLFSTAGEDNKNYISRLYAETLYILSRKGFSRSCSQTPRSFANNDLLSSCEALKQLTAMLEEEQYGNIKTNSQRQKQAEQYLKDIQTFCRSVKPMANCRTKTNTNTNTNTNDTIAEKDDVSHNSQKEIND